MDTWSPWTHCARNGGKKSSGSPSGAAPTAYACLALWPAVKPMRTATSIFRSSRSVGAGQEPAGSCRAGSRSPGVARDEGPCRDRGVASLVRARQDTSRSDAAVKDDRLYLHHMLERCRRITRFIGPGREKFIASEQLKHAVIRNIEVTGEAACRHSIGRASAACATS